MFDLRVEIYKKLVLEEENLKFEKTVGETVKLKNQNDNLSETPEQKKLSNILRINQKLYTIICLKIILIFQYLVLWQKNYIKQKIKGKQWVSRKKSRIDGVI